MSGVWGVGSFLSQLTFLSSLSANRLYYLFLSACYAVVPFIACP